MSGPELPYKISSSEEIIACLRKMTKIVDDFCNHLRLDLNKVHQRDQTMLRNFKLQMQPQEVPVSGFSILTNPTSRKTVASSDLNPDQSAGIYYGGVIAQGFRGPFLINSYCHDFEKVDEGRKMSSQMWVRMAVYRNYITYAGRKLKNIMWLRMAGYRKYISYRYIFISSFISLTKYAGRKINNLM